MNAAAKIGAYMAGLALIFGGALGLGNVVGPLGGEPAKPSHGSGGHAVAAPAPQTTAGHGEHAAPAQQAENSTPGGLQVSENGYSFTPLTTAIKPDEPTDFRFTVTGPDGKAVTDYQVQHDKKLHFVVVSRDLGTFQHLHPVEDGDGVWSVKLTLPEAGAYRAFADFAPTGGQALTLGGDLLVSGDYTPKALPAASRTSEVDGYTVTLDGELLPGRQSKLTLKVSKDGKPVTDLQPYLGAYGHLVALRGGDLAYLHVHPDGEPGDGKTRPGPEIVFYAEVPSRGDYRLFLDFQHEGKVRTADFTLGAEQDSTVDPNAKPTAGSTEHGAGHKH
ncbi:hypothetical protein [Streptosporangium sandarakinum]|uniref:hypothetical protein n=1 Tax=Streptosporangium sandarakinum TaxID=1260955 RepID=UPI0037123A7E